jgi:hypothetical protein
MKRMSADELRELGLDIDLELAYLRRLEGEVGQVQTEIVRDPARAALFYENLALKLHNFYTGCERIFRLVAAELNGALPEGFDWHKRLLERMGAEREERPALLSPNTVQDLHEFLAFRHVVRNVYGFELDSVRVERLVVRYPQAWHQFEADVTRFVFWLRTLAERVAQDADR